MFGAGRCLQDDERSTIRQAVTLEVRDVDRHDFADAGLVGQPVQRSVGQVHFPLAIRIAAHPSRNVVEMIRFEGVDLRPSELDPFQQLEALRRISSTRPRRRKATS